MIWGVYCAFLGYQIRKHGIDTKILNRINNRWEQLNRNQANIMLDAIAERQGNPVPAEPAKFRDVQARA